jgi:predicted aspartyl protease
MSTFKVSVVARNTKDESLVSPPAEALVDTGSELTWLPKDLLTDIKIAPVRKRSFSTATKQLVTRDTGYAIVSAEGFETVDEVVFAEPGDLALLGVRTLEGFGVMVDNIAHRFVATTTLVATAREGVRPGMRGSQFTGIPQRARSERDPWVYRRI